ncbi:unnamed protein product [Orchesella dallaii]|uniref:Uncharacterized protein n=1 Tax=Orchesella dallaii TaxID=48710 RepID=A0ABP1RCW1_9HEXA
MEVQYFSTGSDKSLAEASSYDLQETKERARKVQANAPRNQREHRIQVAEARILEIDNYLEKEEKDVELRVTQVIQELSDTVDQLNDLAKCKKQCRKEIKKTNKEEKKAVKSYRHINARTEKAKAELEMLEGLIASEKEILKKESERRKKKQARRKQFWQMKSKRGVIRRSQRVNAVD